MRSILFSVPKKKIQNNQENATYYGSIIKSIFCIPFYHIFIFLTKDSDQYKKENANIKEITPNRIVNDRFSGLRKNGDMTPAVNQAAAMVFKNSDNALYWLGVKCGII